MWPIILWLVLSYSTSSWSQHANPQTWAEIESALSANQIKMNKLVTEKDLLVRERSRIVNLERDKEIAAKLKDLDDEILKLQANTDDMQRQLQFRFPERGLQLGITDPVNSIESNIKDSEPTQNSTNKNKEIELTPSVKDKQSVPKAMELLRRQFGQPVKSKLPTKITNDEKSAHPSKEPNPILDKIIIQK